MLKLLEMFYFALEGSQIGLIKRSAPSVGLYCCQQGSNLGISPRRKAIQSVTFLQDMHEQNQS